MIDLFSLWQDFQSAVNTSQNGWFRPETDFVRGVNEISTQLWNDYTAMAEKSQEVKDKLFPFLRSKNTVVESATAYYGVAKKPVGYGRLASVRIIVHKDKLATVPAKDVDEGKCDGWKTQEEITDEYYDNVTEYPATIIDNQRWGPYCQHLTKGPTLEKPGVTQVNDQFKVAPRKVSVVVIDYYVNPKEATYKYTTLAGNPQTGSGDQIVYLPPPASTPLEWPEQMRKEFLEKLKNWYILYTRDQIGNSINLQQKQVEK